MTRPTLVVRIFFGFVLAVGIITILGLWDGRIW